MKFKWTGSSGIKDIDLVLAGIKPHYYSLKKGDIIEVPDNNKLLISRMEINGNYKEYVETKKIKETKKEKKEDK